MVDYLKLLHFPLLPDGYNMISADQPSNASIDGVFIFCKKSLCVCNSEISNISDITYCKARVKNKKNALLLFVDLQVKIVSKLTSLFQIFKKF